MRCKCGHDWERHVRSLLGAEPCMHVGCGCKGFEQDVPKVGDGATLCCWTDRYAGTVVNIDRSSTGRTIWVDVQEDTATLVGGSIMSEQQTYEYAGNPAGRKYRFRSLDGGPWKAINSRMRVSFGHRNAYRDPCF